MFLLSKYPHLEIDKMGELRIGNHDYRRIISDYNTPVFVFVGKRIGETCKKFLEAFKNYPRFLACYSYKTNYLPDLCKIISSHGIGAEVVSDVELELALRCKVPPDQIILNGPYKSDRLLKRAISNGIKLINIDSLNEIPRINKIAQKKNTKQNIGITLRKNEKAKIGISISERTLFLIKKSLSKAKNVVLSCVHSHMGTQIIKRKNYELNLKTAARYAEELKRKLNIDITSLDLGGGFPEMAVIGDQLEDIARRIIHTASRLDKEYELVFEPGRFIIGDSCVLLSRIHSVKDGALRWILLDAGTNILSKASKSNYRILIADKLEHRYTVPTNIGGPLPTEIDVIAKNYPLPKAIEEGDSVAILNSGAYTVSLSSQFCQLRPPVLLIDDHGIKVIKKKETLEKDILG
ncbi:MAG: diaminopimelate decarboxylase family protein [Candidatus Hodarchaeota archaeon]